MLAATAGAEHAGLWSRSAGQARDAGDAVAVAGMVLGALPGFVVQVWRLRFGAAGAVRQTIARRVPGMAVLMLPYPGVRLVPVPKGSAVALASKFTRFLLCMLWAAAGAPWLFVRPGLAGRLVPQ